MVPLVFVLSLRWWNSNESEVSFRTCSVWWSAVLCREHRIVTLPDKTLSCASYPAALIHLYRASGSLWMVSVELFQRLLCWLWVGRDEQKPIKGFCRRCGFWNRSILQPYLWGCSERDNDMCRSRLSAIRSYCSLWTSALTYIHRRRRGQG